MTSRRPRPRPALEGAVRAAVAVWDIGSAAIFVARPGSADLELGAAAGIEGPALDGLVAAVRNPDHPIRRTLSDADPTWDVAPTNPGGPALRSHLPLRADGGAVGVLAVAHERPLDAPARETLERLAALATATITEDQPAKESR